MAFLAQHCPCKTSKSSLPMHSLIDEYQIHRLNRCSCQIDDLSSAIDIDATLSSDEAHVVH